MNRKVYLAIFILAVGIIVISKFDPIFLTKKVGTVPACIKKEINNIESGVLQSNEEANIGLNELELLKNDIPACILLETIDPRIINDQGIHIRNQKSFIEVSAQRSALDVVLLGIIQDDRLLIEKGVRAIEYGFSFQAEDGSFQNSLGYSSLETVSANAFFLAATGNSIQLIETSKYGDEFRERFRILKPSIEKALGWLSQDEVLKELIRQDRNTPNRLLVDANAFMLNGIFLERGDIVETGDSLLNLALSMQDKNGVFQEKGGHDSSYQAVNILFGMEYLLWRGDETIKIMLWDALREAVEWEKSRIDVHSGMISEQGNTRTGSHCKERGVTGKCKNINFSEVAKALVYWGVLSNDQEASLKALKVIEYIFKHS